MAKQTVIGEKSQGNVYNRVTSVVKVPITFTADPADGSFADVTVPNVGGYLVGVNVKPGNTVPTTGIDLTVKQDGVDILLSGGDIATAAPAVLTPQNTLGDASMAPCAGDLVVGITGNSVNDAEVTVYLFFSV